MALLSRHEIRRRMARIRQRGLTLIEAATVLAILAFVVAGIMMLYTTADQSRKTSQTLSDLASVQQAVRSVYGGQSSFTGVTQAALINAKALPSRMISGTNARHAFNGTVVIAAADAGGGAGSGFSVAFSNIPKDPCVKITTSDLGRGLYSLAVGTGTAVVQPNLPLSPANAATACASDSSNTITWIFN